jgi:hypothetical protein
MGGIIEDKIFEVLGREEKSARDIQENCMKISYERTLGVIGRHLRKMVTLRQLAREKSAGIYVYYNPAMMEEKT